MSHEKYHPFIEFFVLLAEYTVAWHSGNEFERAPRPPRWARRFRLVTLPVWWMLGGVIVVLFIGLVFLLVFLAESVPALIDKFKEAWNNV